MGGEIFGQSALQRSADYAAQFQSGGSCVEELLRAVQYKEILFTADGANNFVIDAPQVPDGRYWLVLRASVVKLTGTGSAFGELFIAPPSADRAPAPKGGAEGFGRFPGIQVDEPSTGATVKGGIIALYMERKVVVPPGWFVRFLSSSSPPGAGSVFALRIAFAELPLSFDALELLKG